MASTTPTPSTTAVSKPVVKKPAKQESAMKSFLSGGVGGICVVLVGHPFDLIKVRMQTGAVAGSGSVFGVLSSTLRSEGIAGVYRGVGAPLVGISPIFAVSFWGYDIGQRIVRWWDFRSQPNVSSEEYYSKPLSMSQIIIAGGISAIPTTAVMAPTERVKCLLQVPNHPYKGMLDCGKHVLSTGGVTSLYRGTVLTLCRDVPGSMAWFGTYEFVKRQLMIIQGIDPATGTLSPLAVLTAGGMAGMACWTVGIPPDVLKSRFQSAPEGTYTGILHVYQTLMKEEGFMAMFSGMRPALIRAFPANAACFFGMELARKMFAFMD